MHLRTAEFLEVLAERIAMALTLKSHAVSMAFGTASFFMADEDKTIRVDVPQDLLACIEGPPPSNQGASRERLTRYRQQFARIAAVKYLAGLYTPEVNVLVVRITADDLIQTSALVAVGTTTSSASFNHLTGSREQ